MDFHPFEVKNTIQLIRELSYERFLEGLIPVQLISYQEFFFWSDPRSLHPGKLWGKKLFKLIWDMVHSIWTARNAQLHETNRIFELQGLPYVKQAITSEYNLGLHRLPAFEFSMLFSSRLEIVLQRPLPSLKQWLLTIRLGRTLHGGINMIQDEFSINGPLRTWLGLPNHP